jgi:hypothetical protein
MNSEDFRKLIAERSSKPTENGVSKPSNSGATPKPGFQRPKSFAPMTPRYSRDSGQSEFARPVAERDASKKRKNKQDKLPKREYVDPDRNRHDETSDERAQKIRELEDMLKKEKISRTTFERLRDDITSGDVSATHLVKGLDRKLLERVRRGEDVLNDLTKTGQEANDKESTPDVDDEFDQLVEKDVVAEVHEPKDNSDTPSPYAHLAGGNLSREEVLSQLKAARKAARPPPEVEKPKEMNTKFKSIGERREDGSYARMEVDDQGRDVMIVTYPNGTVKRKVRKGQKKKPIPEPTPEAITEPVPASAQLSSEEIAQRLPKPTAEPPHEPSPAAPGEIEEPEEPAKPMGRDESGEAANDDDVYDIFGDVGEYDPLAGMSDEELESKPKVKEPPSEKLPSNPRNYFNDSTTKSSRLSELKNPLLDPDALAAMTSRMRKIDTERLRDSHSPASDSDGDTQRGQTHKDEEAKEARLKRKLAELQGVDRDAEDLDMGFGGSRMDDVEEMEMDGKKIRLSEWGEEDKGQGGRAGLGAGKRKRGPKKKKGDKNSAADVMRVMDARQKG